MTRRISIAPMMDYTDRHFRRLLRAITKKAYLYTEMITTHAIIHGDRERLLNFSEVEHPLALQLGGCDPKILALSSGIGEEWGYDEINLNVGCPSDRVQSGKFGACLMKEPQLVADCIAAMKAAVKIPVTIKMRIGVDDYDHYEWLHYFVKQIQSAGCQTFILHARKAWLKGLSPKENRTIPPLDYDRVYQLKKDFADLEIIINGGIKTFNETEKHLQYVDGIMLGRVAYSNPYLLATVDQDFYQQKVPLKSRYEIILDYLSYVMEQHNHKVPLRHLTRHLLGIFQGVPEAKSWRRRILENSNEINGLKSILEQYQEC